MVVKNFTWNFPRLFSDTQIRYKFASKFTTGDILDYSYNSHMAYTGSKILLNNFIIKVYHYNISEGSLFCELRKLTNDKSLDLSLLEDFVLLENFFDSIISFDTLCITNHFDTFSLFKKILKNNGVAIISIPNPDNFQFEHNISYSKNEFQSDLNKFFKEVKLFSYFSKSVPTQIPVKSKLAADSQLLLLKSFRKPIKFLMKKFDKNLNFFELHMKNKYVKIVDYENSKFQTSSYIVPSDEIPDSDSLYYIALVTK